MAAKRPISVSSAVQELFECETPPRDLIMHLLTAWTSNLEATERRVNRALLSITIVFAGFLALDTGLLAKVSFQGSDIQRTGLILCFVPVVIAFLHYRCSTQISFIHDLRTAIAVLYRKLHESVYFGGLDLLTHFPSVRNLEAYDTFFAPHRLESFHERTTDVVAISLIIGPLVSVVYCFVRLWSYTDVGWFMWAVSLLLSFLFFIRAWFYGLRDGKEDVFSTRSRELASNQANSADAKKPRG